MTYIVSGRTYDHRATLVDMGGQWDSTARHWHFNYLSATQRAKLRALTGVIVTEPATPAPSERPKPDISALEDAIAALLGDDNTSNDDVPWIGIDLAEDDASSKPRRSPNRKSVLYGDDTTYHNHFADQNPAAYFGFSSVNAMVEYLDRIAPEQSNDTRRNGWQNGNETWRGTNTMSAALTLAREGWPEGVEAAAELIERLSLENPRVRRRKPSLAGGSVNVGRMLSGDPLHMVRRPKQPGRKVITFFVECGYNGNITVDTAVVRAALIAAMIDLMENVGYSCAIVAVDTSIVNEGNALYQLVVNLKESGERLNIADIVFALGHPSFLRRLSFAICSSVSETRSIWDHQGSASNSFDDEYRCGPGEFYVPVISKNLKPDDDPLSLLKYITPAKLPIKLEHDK